MCLPYLPINRINRYDHTIFSTIEAVNRRAHPVGSDISFRDEQVFIKPLANQLAGFAHRMNSEVRDQTIQNDRIGFPSHTQPQIVIHRMMQRSIDRPDALPQIPAAKKPRAGRCSSRATGRRYVYRDNSQSL